MKLRHPPVRWRSARARLVLLAAATLLAAAIPVLAQLQVSLAWPLGVAAIGGVAASLLLPLVLERVKGVLGEWSGSRVLLGREALLRCRVAQAVDPLRFGVHPALAAAEGGGGEHPRMPLYVARDIDQELDEALRSDRLVLLLGDAAAGKSRSAYEALHRVLADRWVLVPRRADSLRRLADAGTELDDAVIWLDDLDRYLGVDGLDTALLERLAGGRRGRVVALATMRTRAYAERSPERSPEHAGGGADKAGRRADQELLDAARVIRLDRALSEPECHRARRLARRDPRIGAALAEGDEGIGLAEFLAAAPRLWDRWRDGRASDVEPAGAAIVTAAVDCRRAGLLGPVSERLLRDLYRDYLDAQTAALLGPDAFEVGLAWATTPVHATSALLTRRGDGYRVFAYLLDRLQRDPEVLPVPEMTWTRLLADLPADDAWSVGITAFFSGHTAVAEAAFQAGTKTSRPSAAALSAHGLGLVHWHNGALQEAERWFRQALAGDQISGLARAIVANSLGELLQASGAPQEAETLLRQAADSGYVPALVGLGRLLQERGDHQAAEEAFHRAAATGSAGGALHLGWLLAERGDLPGAERSYRQAARHGSVEAARRLGRLLHDRGDTTGAIRWWRVAANAGDLDAANDLGVWLAEQGELVEARDWLEPAADLGDAAAAYNLAMVLRDQGEDAQAERRLRQSAETGGLVAAVDLAALLMERGELDEADRWLRRVAEAPDEEVVAHQSELRQRSDATRRGVDLRLLATVNRGELAYRRHDRDQAKRYFEQAAAAGDTVAMDKLARLEQVVAEEQEVRLAAERGDPTAVIELGILLIERGELDQAERWLRPLAEAGHERARLELAIVLHERGDVEVARQVLPELADTEHPDVALGVAEVAVRWGMFETAERVLHAQDPKQNTEETVRLGGWLLGQGLPVEAAWFFERAAQAGHVGAQANLGHVLLQQGQVEEGEVWLRRSAEAGHPQGQYNLGFHLRHRGELVEAEHWYRRAAEQGHHDAENNLGLLLAIRGQPVEAEVWLRRAAETGDHDAESNLGALLGTQGRVAEAEQWYRRAADAGHRPAAANLGNLLTEQGRTEEAEVWYWRAARP
jgi:TPR repeat protein